jgi:bifunctional NMN adenylyltransferase/nudix hydrolase
MKYKYDYLVFIGRFQPLHNGHVRVIERALELAQKVIILVGSSYGPRTLRNPWTFEERRDVITRTFSEGPWKDRGPAIHRIEIMPLMDYTYDDEAWVEAVQKAVWNGSVTGNIGLIGCSKDHTSYYLKLFPQWGSEAVEFVDPLNSTDFRNAYFSEHGLAVNEQGNVPGVPVAVTSFLHDFCIFNARFVELAEEAAFIAKYKASWTSAPYPVQFITTDAVVVQSGHVLLVERRAFPGKGLFALPGGFVDPNETLENAAIRELKEETRIKVSEGFLKGCLKGSRYFDDPNRSSRGRTLTHAFFFHLEPQASERFQLPKVRGGDDAAKAMWVPLSHLRREQFFEDHFHIINAMVKTFRGN